MTNASREHNLKLVKRALREYRVFKTILQDLEWLSGIQSNPETARDIHDKLGELREHLSTLFHFEEKGGLFEDILSRLPAMDGKIKELKSEHPDFLETIHSLADRMAETGSSGFGALQGELREFLERLKRHEASESDLIQRAYYVDEGAGD